MTRQKPLLEYDNLPGGTLCSYNHLRHRSFRRRWRGIQPPVLLGLHLPSWEKFIKFQKSLFLKTRELSSCLCTKKSSCFIAYEHSGKYFVEPTTYAAGWHANVCRPQRTPRGHGIQSSDNLWCFESKKYPFSIKI